MTIEPHDELITFNIALNASFWDKPPVIKILVNGLEKFYGEITNQGISKITFKHKLSFDQSHQLSIVRTGKTNNQRVSKGLHGDILDQIISIDSIVIDGVNIRNILWVQSWYEPDYPEPWASQQNAQGIVLEKKIPGETCFGHNGTWKLNFTSPFYRFVMNWMEGQK
jgi:hypothetical protein